jgi:hypothetical protein
MPTSRSHGRPYVEAPRHDELPDGVPAPSTALASAGDERRHDGTFTQGASTAQAAGGKAHKGRTRLSHRIEAPTLTPESQRRARTLRRAMASEIAAGVGGGICDVITSLLVKFAAEKTAAAAEAFAVGDYDTHRKLTESARMDLMYAREHAAKAAAARPRNPTDDPHARIAAELAKVTT